MKKLLRAGARARTRLFGAACSLHWRLWNKTYGIDVDDTEGVNCNMDCEAVGGPYECLCTVVPNTDEEGAFLKQDPQDAAEKVEPYVFDQDYDGLN